MTARRQLIPGLAMLGLLLTAAAPVQGRTWNVEKDGSGDFTVIQAAVDAASSGDVIEIGVGRFDEFQTVQGGTHWFDVHILVPDGMSLSFVGAGRNQTTIGPEDAESHSNSTYGFGGIDGVRLSVHGLGIENCSQYSIGITSGSLEVVDCRFYYGSEFTTDTEAINGGFTEGASIVNCYFEGFYQAVATINSPGGVTISNCQFVNCLAGLYSWTPSSSNVNLNDCYFECGAVGFGFLGGAGGRVERCVLRNCIMSLADSGEAEVYDCEVTRDDGGNALYLTNNDPVTLANNLFQSNGTVVILASYGLGTFQDNHFLRTGDGLWIETRSHSSFHDHEVDLSGNWWGTTDVDEIAAGIWDCADFNTAYNCVTFEPIADGPVAVEAHSWTGVKELFR